MDNDVIPAASVRTSATRDVSEYSRLVSERFAPLTIDTDRGGRFRGQIRGRSLGELEVFDVRATQHRVERSASVAAVTPRRRYMLHLQTAGVGEMAQDGREATLHPGDMAFYDSDRPYSLSLDDTFRNSILVFPQHLLKLPHHDTQQFSATKIGGSQGFAKMVAPFLRQLSTDMDHLPAHQSARFAHAVVDLVSTVLQEELGSAPGAEPRQHDTMTQLYAFIEEHLASPTLGPQRIAAENFISVRTLHAMFSKTGTSVASWIRHRRLELSRAALANPELDALPIHVLMVRFGFVDAAHFSRTFKTAYGESPTEFRRRTRSA
ncbi:helix-turn-helix domain-containing protein [Leucobacter luti]|uniref:AraC family transcriptional regulator n=1 Tax=Leucobacter luti TaxID=340320 RepID=A0A4V6MCV8_9MICO|nr:helix-turn-helix domain-containing protein [Leucobacter luti]MBL3698545.1 helix-turn-helix domain-containing protein [Leucobacter luti]RZT65919.1 AraC family transcriptional regulator [Leucobacter luti]